MADILGDKRKRTRVDPDLAARINKLVEEEERQNRLNARKKPVNTQQQEDKGNDQPAIITGRYGIIESLIYGKAMGVLRQDFVAGRIPKHPTCTLGGVKVIRALTMKETALVRLNDYDTLKNPDGSDRTEDDRLALFKIWSFTSSGIAYLKKSTKCKIVPISEHLVTIDESYDKASIPIKYSSIIGKEIDINKGKYNQGLTLDEVLKHRGWIESFEGDKKALADYANLVFRLLKNPEKAMGFYVVQNPENELRALALSDLGNLSLADGLNSLNSDARFVRVNMVEQ